jgi:hypothetical protein
LSPRRTDHRLSNRPSSQSLGALGGVTGGPPVDWLTAVLGNPWSRRTDMVVELREKRKFNFVVLALLVVVIVAGGLAYLGLI